MEENKNYAEKVIEAIFGYGKDWEQGAIRTPEQYEREISWLMDDPCCINAEYSFGNRLLTIATLPVGRTNMGLPFAIRQSMFVWRHMPSREEAVEVLHDVLDRLPKMSMHATAPARIEEAIHDLEG